MTYGTETWSLNVGLITKLKVAQRAMERAMLGVSLCDKIRNTEIRRRTEKLNMKFDFKFKVIKKDGETYLKGKDGSLSYKYDVLGKVSFAANNLFMGDQDVSVTVTNLLNQSWKLVMQTVGNQLMSKAMERVKALIGNLFDHVPTKYFISEDLSAYVTN
ncbi:hypothetical protein evm_000750 [Chilo suppressalis]|nr:hypothetical protein evm_000750 [Chilo suppressalis]